MQWATVDNCYNSFIGLVQISWDGNQRFGLYYLNGDEIKNLTPTKVGKLVSQCDNVKI
jgi:hypothetical protein